jgi:hypothetical protein
MSRKTKSVEELKQELDDFELTTDFLAPFWTDDTTTVKQAMATMSSLLTAEIRSGSGKSAEQLADDFLARHYPNAVDAHQSKGVGVVRAEAEPADPFGAGNFWLIFSYFNLLCVCLNF